MVNLERLDWEVDLVVDLDSQGLENQEQMAGLKQLPLLTSLVSLKNLGYLEDQERPEDLESPGEVVQLEHRVHEADQVDQELKVHVGDQELKVHVEDQADQYLKVHEEDPEFKVHVGDQELKVHEADQ